MSKPFPVSRCLKNSSTHDELIETLQVCRRCGAAVPPYLLQLCVKSRSRRCVFSPLPPQHREPCVPAPPCPSVCHCPAGGVLSRPVPSPSLTTLRSCLLDSLVSLSASSTRECCHVEIQSRFHHPELPVNAEPNLEGHTRFLFLLCLPSAVTTFYSLFFILAVPI